MLETLSILKGFNEMRGVYCALPGCLDFMCQARLCLPPTQCNQEARGTRGWPWAWMATIAGRGGMSTAQWLALGVNISTKQVGGSSRGVSNQPPCAQCNQSATVMPKYGRFRLCVCLTLMHRWGGMQAVILRLGRWQGPPDLGRWGRLLQEESQLHGVPMLWQEHGDHVTTVWWSTSGHGKD